MLENLCLNDIPKFLYYAILQSVKDPFNIIDRNFRILWTNKTKANTQMIGKFCYELFQGRSEPCSACPVRSVFGNGKVCTMERWVDLWDGWCELRAYPVYDKNRNVAYAVKIGFDISDRMSNLARQKRYVDDLENSLEEITKKKTSALFECQSEGIRFSLTDREVEVLDLMAKGFTNTEISKIIAVSPHTVKSHAIHIFNKLGVNDRTQASVLAARLKLI